MNPLPPHYFPSVVWCVTQWRKQQPEPLFTQGFVIQQMPMKISCRAWGGLERLLCKNSSRCGTSVFLLVSIACTGFWLKIAIIWWIYKSLSWLLYRVISVFTCANRMNYRLNKVCQFLHWFCLQHITISSIFGAAVPKLNLIITRQIPYGCLLHPGLNNIGKTFQLLQLICGKRVQTRHSMSVFALKFCLK